MGLLHDCQRHPETIVKALLVQLTRWWHSQETLAASVCMYKNTSPFVCCTESAGQARRHLHCDKQQQSLSYPSSVRQLHKAEVAWLREPAGVVTCSACSKAKSSPDHVTPIAGNPDDCSLGLKSHKPKASVLSPIHPVSWHVNIHDISAQQVVMLSCGSNCQQTKHLQTSHAPRKLTTAEHT